MALEKDISLKPLIYSRAVFSGDAVYLYSFLSRVVKINLSVTGRKDTLFFTDKRYTLFVMGRTDEP